jgi:ATP-dependent exoDNAse (exonuclease V) beta subunit
MRFDTVRAGLHVMPRATPELSRPGSAARRHDAGPTGYPVVWWSPSALALDAEPPFGLRREDLISKDVPLSVVAEARSAYDTWANARVTTIERGSTPSLVVRRITEFAHSGARPAGVAGLPPVDVIELPREGRRPKGRRFGTLVHAVLATVPLDAPEDVVKRTAETQGRVLAATAAEVNAAASVVVAVLRHDLMARARAAGAVRRETPLTWMQKDGTLIEGVLDLAFTEEGVTTVVDFKTDHELAAGEARYRAQLQQYVSAVATVTKGRAAGVLFRV